MNIDDIIQHSARNSADRLELWERIVDMLMPTTTLEVGVWKGGFAARLLAKCQSIRSYWMIDSWRRLPHWNKPLNIDDASLEAAYSEAMAATSFARDRVTVLRGTTIEVIDRVTNDSIDFAYIDGDHTLRGITIDLINVWPKIRPGGSIAGDDLSPTIWQHAKNFEPTLVFPMAVYFAESMGARMFALPYEQYLIQKPEAGKRLYAFVDLTGSYADTALLRQLLQ